MAFRSYDPAIGRFNGIDPVTHYSMGTSVAFDNNPVFWADPSGANSSTGPLALRQYNKTGNADALGTGLFASGTFDFMKPASGGSSSSSSSVGSPPNKYKGIFRALRIQNANKNLSPAEATALGVSDFAQDNVSTGVSLLISPALFFLKSTVDLAKTKGYEGAFSFLPIVQVINQPVETGDAISNFIKNVNNENYYEASYGAASFGSQKAVELALALGMSRMPVNFKELRTGGGRLNGLSISEGYGYGAQPRIDFHPLSRASKPSRTLTIPNWARKYQIPLPHYHRGKGNSLKYHRPWELDPNGKRKY